MKKVCLTVVLILFFAFSMLGQVLTGFKSYNEERVQNHLAPLAQYSEYLTTGHFISSVAENMESEFLQMALFVLLTVFLYQVGSAESKKLPEELTEEEILEEKQEEEYVKEKRKQYPVLWRLYEHSLTITLFTLFFVFFIFHAIGSTGLVNEERQMHGLAAIQFMDIFGEAEFWFESFQNWQSEFFSIAILGLLSIFLREHNSAQSKKMSDPIWKTGDK